jgi:hypothetical protein
LSLLGPNILLNILFCLRKTFWLMTRFLTLAYWNAVGNAVLCSTLLVMYVFNLTFDVCSVFSKAKLHDF